MSLERDDWGKREYLRGLKEGLEKGRAENSSSIHLQMVCPCGACRKRRGEEKANDSKTCQGAGCDVCEDCEQAQLGKYESLQERIAENAGMNEDSMHDGDEDCFL